MAKFNAEDIAGYYVDEKLVCSQCIGNVELQELEEENILLQDAVENNDTFYFCDRCKKRIQ